MAASFVVVRTIPAGPAGPVGACRPPRGGRSASSLHAVTNIEVRWEHGERDRLSPAGPANVPEVALLCLPHSLPPQPLQAGMETPSASACSFTAQECVGL